MNLSRICVAASGAAAALGNISLDPDLRLAEGVLLVETGHNFRNLITAMAGEAGHLSHGAKSERLMRFSIRTMRRAVFFRGVSSHNGSSRRRFRDVAVGAVHVQRGGEEAIVP